MFSRPPGNIATILEAIVEASPLGMVTTEGAAHRIGYANPAFCRLVGLAADAIMNRPLREALPEFGEPDTVSLLDRVYQTGTTGRAVDLRPAHAGVGWSHATYTVWPIHGDEHQPVGVLVEISDDADQVLTRDYAAESAAEIRDVNRRLLVAGLAAQEHADTQTALNTALRELLETRERAADERETLLERERAARAQAEAALRVRDEFLAIASHELRTPLTSVKGTAQLALRALERGIVDEARTVRHLQTIHASADRLERLLIDLMDVSRMRSQGPIIRPNAMDLAALVDSLAERYTGDPGDHRVIIEILERPLLVEGDSGRLEQVLDNMLSNAVKYTPAGGEITVRLGEILPGSSPDTTSPAPSGAQDEGGGIVLTVTDTGIGMPLGEQGRIFEPFGRATNATQHGMPGMGLGLYICRQIVEAHGGRMWAESAGEGQGTTVGVWLPRETADNPSE